MNIKATIIVLMMMSFFMVSCTSLFNSHESVAVDKLYVYKKCPLFFHKFEIAGKKYESNDVSQVSVIMKLSDLTQSLASNTEAREVFNDAVREMNQDKLVKDAKPGKRVIKKIYIEQKCPTYEYSPKFVAVKLTDMFKAEDNITYVVISLDKMVFQMEKHKHTKEIFNNVVMKLNEE